MKSPYWREEWITDRIFCIIIVQMDRDFCEALAADVLKCIDDYRLRTSLVLGAYEVELLDSFVTIVVDCGLQEYRASKNDALESLEETLAERKTALTEMQIQILNKDVKDEEEETEAVTVESASVRKKYLVIGAGAGI